jgi:tetratricopeptide (TPR) repeat protein/predicted Ser/Thr protein kinase
VPDRIISHYKLVDKIGGGGMGVVYKAIDTKLGRAVALKFLPPGFTRDETAKKRFLHEAQAASLIDHPNICSIYEIDETPEGQVFISMAYCEGESLRDRIKKGRLPVREVFEIMFSVADGLACAHERGVVHRDVKPANIVITNDGFVKIIDFGLAKLVDRSRVTRPGHAPGTLSYMSPEQVTGKEVDGRADIWSLGIVAYEALTGTLPFEADIEPAMMYRILNEDPPSVCGLRSEVPSEFETIIHKCLAKDPALRYATAADLMRDLADLGRRLGWQSSGTYRRAVRVGATPAEKRRRLALSVVIIAGIAGVIAYYWAARDRSTENAPFTTQLRLAVLPMDNIAGTSVTPEFANGLSEWIAHVFERIGAHHSSMWVVPFDHTLPGLVAAPSQAKDAFGVNRIVTGSIERYAEGFRLSLSLDDSETLRPIRSVNVDYALDLTVLERELPGKAAELIDLRAAAGGNAPPVTGFTANSTAFEEFLRGLGYLQRYRVGESLDLAVGSFRRSVAADSLFADARAALALALARDCAVSKREEICGEALAVSRASLVLDSASVYVNQTAAAAARELKDMDGAITACRRVLAVEPKNAGAYRQMGYAFNRLDRVAEAEAAYRAGAAASPDCWQSYVNLGWFLNARGRTDEAVVQFEKAVALAPGDSWTLNTLGNIAIARDEWGKARELYLRSFAIQPRCNPCRNIGLLYYLEGLFAESATYFKFALEYCDSTAADYYQRWQDLAAALYWVDGKRDEAISAFRRAIALAETQLAESPDDPELLAYTAGCYAMIGERASALALIDRFIAVGSEEPHLLFIVGQSYEQLGDRERALNYIGQAVRLNYRLSWIEAEPILKDLTQDIRFRQLVGATAGEVRPGGSKTE